MGQMCIRDRCRSIRILRPVRSAQSNALSKYSMQPGFDNGGLTGVVRWHHSPRAVAYALDVLTRLAKRYRDRAALFGIEVLNEPIDWLTYAMSSSSRQAKEMCIRDRGFTSAD